MKSYYQEYTDDEDEFFGENIDEFVDEDGFYYDSDGLIFPIDKKNVEPIKSKKPVDKPEPVYVVNNKPAPWANIKKEVVDFRKILEEKSDTKKSKSEVLEKETNIQQPSKRLLWNNKNIKIETLENEVKPNDSVIEFNRSKKTKFCLNVIDTGKCTRKVCAFAHSLKELNFPECRFTDNCKKKMCMYKHPCETVDEFKIRTNFKAPNNIK